MRALIVGGGPAGATAAIALGRLGIESLVVEVEGRARPVGIGFAMQNSPLRALHHLGLLETVVEHGFPHEAVNLCAPDGTIVHRIVTEPLVPNTPSLVAIPRVTMAEILDDAVTRTPGAEIRYEATFTALREVGDQVEADLTDGTTERFDLVIGADGVHSAVRRQFFPDAPEPRLARQVIWRASAPRPPEADRYLLHDLGPGGRAAVVPISDDEVYLWRLHTDDGSPRPPAEQRLELFRETLAPFGGVIPIVAERIRPESIDYRSLQALLVPAPWYRGRVVLVGDAAHATTPHIAYGAGMAIEDSVVLAEELSRTDSVDAALEAFMARRFDRCQLVVETSLQLSEWEVDPPEDRSQHQQMVGRALEALSQPLVVHHVQLVEPADLPDVAVGVGEAARAARAVLGGRPPRPATGGLRRRDEVVHPAAVPDGEAGDARRCGGVARLVTDRIEEPVPGEQRDDDVLVDDDRGGGLVGGVLVDPEAECLVELPRAAQGVHGQAHEDHPPGHRSSSANVSATQSAMNVLTWGRWSRPMCSVAPSSGVKTRSSRLGELTACS